MAGDGIVANTVNAGGVATGLQRDFTQRQKDCLGAAEAAGAFAYKTVQQGAAITMVAAVAPEFAHTGGHYPDEGREAHTVTDDADLFTNSHGVKQWALDPDAAAKLWAVSLGLMHHSRGIILVLAFWDLDRGVPVTRWDLARQALPLAYFRFAQDEDRDAVVEVSRGAAARFGWLRRYIDYASMIAYMALPSWRAAHPVQVWGMRRPSVCQIRAQFWFEAPSQGQITRSVPFVVPLAFASRHLPDASPTTVPLEPTIHCWLLLPLQSLMSTAAASAVELPTTSRHLVSNTVSWFVFVEVQLWLLPPLQSHSAGRVPFVWLPAGTSMHRAEAWPFRMPATAPRAQVWFAPPLQPQISSGVLLAVPRAVASRHRPDETLTTEPLALTVHCWLAEPLQS
jgi:hypothetical protein